MKKVITLLMILFVCQLTTAQDYKFGKVSKEELQEKFNPLDSSANATYLYKKRKTFFEYYQGDGFQLITEIHERIKIYNKEGFSYATKSINLYKSNSANENLTSLKANTFNLVNGKIESSKLKKDGVFKTEKNKFINETKFTMPNIKEGSVVEFKYRVKSPFYQNIEEFVFQHNIPIKKLEAIFEVPEYFDFKVNTKGFLMVVPITKNRRGKLAYKNKISVNKNSDGDARQRYNAGEVEYTKKEYLYSLSNVIALKDEPYVNNINNYRASVKYELSYVKYPQEPIKYYSTTWEDVVKTIYKDTRFGTELKKSGYYENDVDALIGSISDPVKRIGLIYNFVKFKIKWNGYASKYTNVGVRKAYKEQVGNAAEINLMLTSMLRHAGLEANPVLVSTRHNGIPLFPTREGYNYVVSSVQLPTGIVLLDATNKYGVPNVLPFRTLNWDGRIIKSDGSSSLINLYPKKKSVNLVSVMVSLDENGDIEGGIRTSKTNHKAMNYRASYLGTDKDQFLEGLENKYDGLEVSDFKVKNAMDLSKPVIESYKFILESQADIIGDKIYFSPLFFLKTIENPFKLEKREFPVDFGYPSKSNYRVIIKIPEGYKVESLPESNGITLPDNLGKFKYVLSASRDNIQLVASTEINHPIIPALYYDGLKEYFKLMIEKENEQIVLTK